MALDSAASQFLRRYNYGVVQWDEPGMLVTSVTDVEGEDRDAWLGALVSVLTSYATAERKLHWSIDTRGIRHSSAWTRALQLPDATEATGDLIKAAAYELALEMVEHLQIVRAVCTDITIYVRQDMAEDIEAVLEYARKAGGTTKAESRVHCHVEAWSGP